MKFYFPFNKKSYYKLPEHLNRNKLSVRKIAIVIFLQIVIVALITFFTSGYSFISIPDYKLNDIAYEDIIAPQDFDVTDMKLTAARKEKARKSVSPVYDFDPDVALRLREKVHQSFEKARQMLRAKEKEQNTTSQRSELQADDTINNKNSSNFNSLDEKNQFYNEIIKIFDNKVTKRQITFFLKKSFNEELENLIINVLNNAQSQQIITTFDDFVTNEGHIIIRNISTGEEKVVKNTKNIVQLSDARQMIPYFYPGELRYSHVNLIKSFIAQNLSSNLSYNINETKQKQDKASEEVLPIVVKIKKGKAIVRRGDEISEEILQQIQELKQISVSQIKLPVMAANALFISFLLSFLWFYYNRSSQQDNDNFKNCLIISIIIILNVILIEGFYWLFHRLIESFRSAPFDDFSYYFYALPFTLGTTLVALLIDIQISLYFAYICGVIFFLLIGGNIYSFFFILFGNVISAYGIDRFKGRGGIIKTGLAVGTINVFTFIFIKMIEEPVFEFSPILFGMGTAFWGSLMSVFFVLALVSLFEALFQVTTDVKLLELSNMNLPILRTLADMAPGTYYHSLIVGTLSEAAAKAIGANPLLARVACYYHDIGKTINPEYFIENQYGGFNIHDNCTPTQSAEKIISHVEKGLKIADQINLPNPIKNIIAEHHGTKRIHYFYEKAKELNGGSEEDIDEDIFRYPGPQPTTKESAIIMLADAVEAASRTIKEPTFDKMRAMVRKLIDITIEDGQFKDCKITVGDLESIKASFLDVLAGHFHHRIQYQGLNFDKEQQKQPEIKKLPSHQEVA
jgi:putative nucleotidyltransferase with HDIG domain